MFDLQSTKGWLFAEGIVASNCAALEIFRVEEEPVPASVAARARRIGGVWVQPQADDGFGFNPGELFRDAVAA